MAGECDGCVHCGLYCFGYAEKWRWIQWIALRLNSYPIKIQFYNIQSNRFSFNVIKSNAGNKTI